MNAKTTKYIRATLSCALFSGTLIASSVSAQEMLAALDPPMSEEAFWGDVPMVMSATRMAQPVVDSPVAVTVITREMIEASGARDIPELFRLVPGFIVGYHDGHTPSVSYHMSLDRYARRMQVLIDGRSIYTTAIGGIPWATLHITMDDIERIEVVRGPNSASYGANSFLGVINIITHHAVADQGSSVKVNVGDEGVRETYVRHGDSSGKWDYRVSASFSQDDGLVYRYDSKRTKKLSFRADYHATADDVITIEGGTGMGTREVENRWSDLSPDRVKEVLNHHQHIRWEHSFDVDQSISLQLYHIFQRNFENFTIRDYVLTSLGPGVDVVLDPLPVDFSRRTERYDLELQHNASVNDYVRTVWGGGVRQDTVWGGQHLLGNSEIGNHLKYGFGNVEWDPDGKWLVNVGVMLESYSTTGVDRSPRVGVNYRFSPQHSLRVTRSRAIRTPSMFEYATNYSLNGSTSIVSGGVVVGAGPDVTEDFILGTRQTGVERIESQEVGFNGHGIDGALSYDIKVFRDKIREIIALESVAHADLSGDVDYYTNLDAINIEGAEMEMAYTFDDGASIRFTHAVSSIEDLNPSSSKDYRKAAPQRSTSLLLIKPFMDGYTFSLAHYFMHEMAGWETNRTRSPIQRLDMKLGKETTLFGLDAEFAIMGRNLTGRYEEMELLRPEINFDYFNEVDPSVYVSMKLSMD